MKKLSPKQKENLLRLLVSIITSHGKKSKGLSIFSFSLENLFSSNHMSIKELISQVQFKLYTLVSVKIIGKDENEDSIIIPYTLTPSLRNTKVVSRLVQACHSYKKDKSFTFKMSQEMSAIILKRPAKSIEALNAEIESALINRSKMRFRW